METMSIQKPRVSYAQFIATKPARTVAWVIEKFIREMNGWDGKPGLKEIGYGELYTLRLLQRSPIGAVLAAKVSRADIIAHCRMRQEAGIKPQTAGQDVVYLGVVLKYAGSAPEWNCEDISNAAVVAAKPYLIKHNLTCKSEPRKVRPKPEQIEQLVAWFNRPGRRSSRRMPMAMLTLWHLRSARRPSETCRMKWEHWDRETHTILIERMKDPRNRNKNKIVALPKEAQAMLEELYPLRDPNEPRIFPFNHRCVIQAYVYAKKKLGIVNLQLRDSRRDKGTRLVEDDGFSPSEAICVTGHETVAVFERTYLSMKPALLKDGPRAHRMNSGKEEWNVAAFARSKIGM